jgi:HlyD family secretion protein
VTVVVILAGAVGGWAGTTALSGALIASGSVVVDSNVKKVQHPVGGVVGELRVRDGDRVKSGDIVVRLDETVTRANLAIITKGLDELTARKARLSGERDGANAIVFPESLSKRAGEPEIAQIMEGERKLFELRRSARAGQKAQLREQSAQLREEIIGLTAQQKAKGREIEFIHRELDGVRDLFKKNLIPISRLTQLEREATRLEGEQAQLVATVAQAKGKIAEIELKIIQIDQDLSSEVAKELREIDGKIGEFVERKIAAEDQLQRVDIRAPQDGTVFQLSVHTVGGVIAPAKRSC